MSNTLKSSNLQNLPYGNISSNNHFFYRDETNHNGNHKIFIDDGTEKNVYLKPNKPIYHIDKCASKKHLERDQTSAFEKAYEESEKIKNYHENKFYITENKRELIKEIVLERNKNIKEKLDAEKKKLQETLTRIIKDALKFTKENNPIISMMPNKITSAINEIKEKRKSKIINSNNLNTNTLNSNSNNNNSTLGLSFNLSQLSSTSANHKKFESNAFLKALGLDLDNLTPDNIKINIDEAYDFIKKWRVNRADINEIIRMKVVNEIMNVEERRSVKKMKKLNEKYEHYIEYKRQKEINEQRKFEENNDSAENESNPENSRVLETQKLVDEIKDMNKEEINNGKINQSKNESLTIGKNTNFTNSNNFISSVSLKNNLQNTKNMKISTIGTTISNQPNSNINIISVNNKLSEKPRTTSNKKNKSNSPGRKKYDVKLKLKPESPTKKKRKLVLNSYKSVDRIIKIINKSDKLKSNENLCKHFRNIRYNKKIDDLTNKLVNQNKLYIEPFEEVEFE